MKKQQTSRICNTAVGKNKMKGGTIVDATIINAPISTKNAGKARDPEVHQMKKGTNGTST